jgi:hypothetical protein
LASDAAIFYEHQRSVGTVWGVTLPPWECLSWEEKLEWEDKYNEQIIRDKEREDHHRSI